MSSEDRPGSGDSGAGWGGPPGSYAQPAPGSYQQPPANRLVWGILTTLFCCSPLGLVATVFAAQANGKQSAGDYAGASEDARKARTWAIVSAAVQVGALVLFFLFFFGTFMAAVSQSGSFSTGP